MAAEGAGNGLADTFNSVAKHMFSPTMIFMMVAMALPAVGAVAASVGTGATLGDIGLATVDMYWQMIKAPFTDGGNLVDAVKNVFSGNFAPASYEMGMMDHSSMVHGTADAGAHAAGHAGHVTQNFNDWAAGISPQELSDLKANAEFYGMTPEEYFKGLSHQ